MKLDSFVAAHITNLRLLIADWLISDWLISDWLLNKLHLLIVLLHIFFFMGRWSDWILHMSLFVITRLKTTLPQIEYEKPPDPHRRFTRKKLKLYLCSRQERSPSAPKFRRSSSTTALHWSHPIQWTHNPYTSVQFDFLPDSRSILIARSALLVVDDLRPR